MRAQRLINILTCVLLLASCGKSNDEAQDNQQAQSDERSYQTPQRRKGGWQDMVSDVAGGGFPGS